MDAGKCANANQYRTYAPGPSVTSEPGEEKRENALEVFLDQSPLLSSNEFKKL